MKPKVVQLHVHKNTVAKKRRKLLKEEAVKAVMDLFNENNIQAFAVIAIGDDESTYTASNDGKLTPSQFALLLRDALCVETLSGATNSDYSDEELEPGA